MKLRASPAGVVTSIDRTLVQSGCKERIEAVLSDRWTDCPLFEWGTSGGRLGWTASAVAEREPDLEEYVVVHRQPSVTLLMQTPDR